MMWNLQLLARPINLLLDHFQFQSLRVLLQRKTLLIYLNLKKSNFLQVLLSSSKCLYQASLTNLLNKKKLLKLKTFYPDLSSVPQILICMSTVKNSLKSWRKHNKKRLEDTNLKMKVRWSNKSDNNHMRNRGIKKLIYLLTTSKIPNSNLKRHLWVGNLAKAKDSMILLWHPSRQSLSLLKWFKREHTISKWPLTLMRWTLMRKMLDRDTIKLAIRESPRALTTWWMVSLEVMA